MLTLLLGSDDFSKKTFINSRAFERGADLVNFSAEEELPPVSGFLETDLFFKPKVFALQAMPEFSATDLEKIILSPNHIIVSQKSLDKRKKENKELLSNGKVTVKEFVLPHGLELNKWILHRAEALGAKMSPEAAEQLAVRLGRDNGRETKIAGQVVSVEEVFDLWQADNEIQKLAAFAAGQEIGLREVIELVSENGEVDVFSLTNAIGGGQKQKALTLLHKFLSLQTGSDEKAGIIQLNALLSEQFRNVAMVQDFLAAKKPENEILEATGWKPGRLFVIKKIAARFPARQILEFLNKLGALDEELKTTSTPPRVLLDLILTQLFV